MHGCQSSYIWIWNHILARAAIIESCDFICYIHFGATVNPLIKKNRMTLAVADGEVESFALVPVLEVAEMVHKSNSYKPSSAIVIIDFLFRHGYVFSPLSWLWTAILVQGTIKSLFPTFRNLMWQDQCAAAPPQIESKRCNCVILCRYIHPDQPGYLQLLQSLRSGDCQWWHRGLLIDKLIKKVVLQPYKGGYLVINKIYFRKNKNVQLMQQPLDKKL